MSERAKRCGTCGAFCLIDGMTQKEADLCAASGDVVFGECRRQSPRAKWGAKREVMARAYWPEVIDLDWCCEWLPREGGE